MKGFNMEWFETELVKKDETKIQGSEAWKKWRNKGLGSSDAAVLLGLSPWKNISQLFQEKLGNWKPEFGDFQRKAMDRGTGLEPIIRSWYEERVGEKFPPDACEHSTETFMRASFDGINRYHVGTDYALGRVLEIKAPNKNDHELAKNGMIPEKYLPQVQWLLLVSGLKICDYVSYGSDDTYAIVTIYQDHAIQEELMIRAKAFWLTLQTGLELDASKYPKYVPQQLDLDLGEIQIEEQGIEALVAETILLQDAHKDAEAKFEVAKEKLKRILGNETEMRKGEAIFGWQTRKGQIDYKNIAELEGIDLEPYRKADTRAFYFKRKSNE